ncbi:site-specific integrase [Shimia sp. R9_2]|uniref:site-specific integrase n=1 Tax=Shimia sp. R9_2 TaxID=2821112 RepID=UPI001AD9A766|nr:site-specific integrase [Shimia sp. R9_2]MBO9396136.1 site-specific integrase [Shimia sp. R9_2]
MRPASYLSTSRHGVFYLRLPIPRSAHPERRRTDLKVSLATREPRVAATLSRLLTVSGQSALAAASARGMRYDEIRHHVQEYLKVALSNFREGIGQDGPMEGLHLTALQNSLWASEMPFEEWCDTIGAEGAERALRSLCEARDIEPDLTEKTRTLMLKELHKMWRAFTSQAVAHNQSFDSLQTEAPPSTTVAAVPAPPVPTPTTIPAEPFWDVVDRYMREKDRSQEWAAKTRSEKTEALNLLAELTDSKPLASLTKADAREIKDILQRMPKNRSKNPQTRGKPVRDILDMKGIETPTARTVNVYIGHYQSLLGWAKLNGYVEENVFDGLRLKLKNATSEPARKAFSEEQLSRLHHHLTINPDGLVKKPEHKWVTLVAMYTGARLNEVAQLDVSDVKDLSGIACIDITTEGSPNKRLKNASSKRVIPIHADLIALGFLEFVEQLRARGTVRLFPALSYCPKNGYGRNVGRWFGDSFLPRLGIDDEALVFHSLRHTMNTQLARKNVPEQLQKAILGHKQNGMTYDTYFTAGFLPDQLYPEVNKFRAIPD